MERLKAHGDTVVPGDCIIKCSNVDDLSLKYRDGTYLYKNCIFASLLGTVSFSESDSEVNVIRRNKSNGSAQVLRIGDYVMCKVRKVNMQMVHVDILVKDEIVLQTPFPGTIRVEDVRTRDIDKVILEEIFHTNAIVKAKVLSYGDTRSYFLTTAADGLGVIVQDPKHTS